MWLKTEKGEFVNLELWAHIKIVNETDDRFVVYVLNTEYGYGPELYRSKTKEEAQQYMDDLATYINFAVDGQAANPPEKSK
ncbi:hypothetical protein LCGC14_0504190 [marine sediment metagenome]|uniref:Uncharacterized protein n=1 Tax=marine sediment metagenome TaxID=412755 RepID=A0A0F9S857_9ZZZZ